MKALALQRHERYQTVAELQQEIEAYRSGYATVAEQASVGKQVWLLIKRRKVEAGILTAAAVIIAVLAAGAFLRINTERRQAQSALSRLRATAPALHRLALSLVEAKRFPEALEKIDDALKLQPTAAEYQNLRGNLCQTLFRFEEARAAYGAAGQLNPGLPFIADNRKLSDRLAGGARGTNEPPAVLLEELRQAMLRQGRTPEAIFLGSRIGAAEQQSLEKWTSHLQERFGFPPGLSRDPEGFFQLTIREQSIADLSPLRDLPLRMVTLHGCRKVSDLSPLAGKALTYLDIRQTGTTDLSPLQGMPLSYFNAAETPLKDLRPLKGMPLGEVVVSGTAVTDLSPLRESPVAVLACSYSAVSDLGPLRGMKLQQLDCYGTQVRDLSPLQGMNSLNWLSLLNTPVADLSPLKGLPLGYLQAGATRITNLEPLRGLPLTELILSGTRISDLSPLRECVKLSGLDLRDCPGIQDLSALAGLPITALSFRGTRVATLEPLRGMKLENLAASVCPIQDLAPLRGMRLLDLDLHQTRITNISVLAGMPLKTLRLDGATGLKNLAPLASCRQLELLTIPMAATNVDALRELPNLRRLGYGMPNEGNWDSCPAPADFWKAYDARNASKRK